MLPESPLERLGWIIGIGLFGILIATIWLQSAGETVIERNRRFLVFAAWLGLGAFGVRQILLFIEGYVASSFLDGIAGVCFLVSIAALAGGGIVLNAASEEARAKAVQDFFRPLTIVKNQFGNINVQGPAAIANQGSHIVQPANISVEIQQQIHSLIDQMKELPASELAEDRKQEAIGHLNTLDHQCMLPPARRDLPKIVTAFQRLPAIFSGFSGIATCFQAWEKLQAVVKSHLGL